MSDATRVYETQVTVPAGTLHTAPLTVPWVTEDNDVADIEIEIPPGHNGVTGIRVMKGDVQLLPYGTGTFLVANGYDRVFPVGEYLPTSDVKIQAYNEGLYSHTFYLRMTVSNHVIPSTASPVPDTSALGFGGTVVSQDPLSPDALIGADTAAALTAGDVTAADLQSVTSPDLTVTPPDTTGP